MLVYLVGYPALWMARGCLALSDVMGMLLRGRPAWLETLGARLLVTAFATGGRAGSSLYDFLRRDPLRHQEALLRLLAHNGRPGVLATGAWCLLCMRFHTPRTDQALQTFVLSLADANARQLYEKLLDARPLGAAPFD